MSTELDAALAKIDHVQRTQDFAKSLGCSYEQASVFAASQKEKFKWTGSALMWAATGRPAADEVDTIRAHLKENKLGFLLPDENPLKDTIAANADPAMMQAALDGNITAKGKLLRGTFHGDLAALETALAAKREKIEATKAAAAAANNKDHSTNPWSRGGWSLRKQGELIRAAGEAKAAQIAAAVGCKIGSTKPNPAYN
jgi:hypothetical protein